MFELNSGVEFKSIYRLLRSANCEGRAFDCGRLYGSDAGWDRGRQRGLCGHAPISNLHGTLKRCKSKRIDACDFRLKSAAEERVFDAVAIRAKGKRLMTVVQGTINRTRVTIGSGYRNPGQNSVKCESEGVDRGHNARVLGT